MLSGITLALSMHMPFVRSIVLSAAFVALVGPAPAHAQTAAVSLQQGMEALQAGDSDRAATIFKEALQRYPRNAQLLFGAAAAARMQGRDADAVVMLKQSLQIDPRFAGAALLLGELLYRLGETEDAIKLYEQALPNTPPAIAPRVRAQIEAWKTEAALPQARAALRDDRFTVMFDGPAQETLAAHALAVLRPAFWRIGKELGAYPSASINVILYTQQQFHDITGAPDWSDGAFDGQIRLPVAGAAQKLTQFDRVLTHELTHAMLKSVAPNAPAWLNEGLAMYFEGRDASQSERRLAAARVFVPLAALRVGFSRLTAAQAAVAYEESAFATSALLARIGPPGLAMFLQDLDAGLTIDEAFARFRFSLAEFEAELARRVGVVVASR